MKRQASTSRPRLSVSFSGHCAVDQRSKDDEATPSLLMTRPAPALPDRPGGRVHQRGRPPVTTPDEAMPAPTALALAQLALGLVTGASKGRDGFNAAWAALVPAVADPAHPLSVAGTTNADLVWAVFALLEPLADDIDLGWYLQQCGQHFAACPLTDGGT